MGYGSKVGFSPPLPELPQDSGGLKPTLRPLSRQSVQWRRLALGLLWLMAAGGSLALARGGPHGSVDPSLVALLRLMAAIKAAMAVAAALLVDWRLARPIPAAMAGGYGIAVALMAAASGMIWQMSHLVGAGVLFHAGLLLWLALAYADRNSAAEMLASLVARRTAAAQGWTRR